MYVSVELNSSSHVPASDQKKTFSFCGGEDGVETVSNLLDFWPEKLPHLKKFKLVAVTNVTIHMTFDDTGVVMISRNAAGEKLEII